MASGRFDPAALDGPLQPLEDLPRELWLQSITNGIGTLPERLQGVLALRKALLQGLLPQTFDTLWPTDSVGQAFWRELAALSLPDNCRYSNELTDHVIRSLLWHSDRIIDYTEGRSHQEAVEIAAKAFADDWQQLADEVKALVYVFDDLGTVINFTRWDASQGLLRSEGGQALLKARRLLEELGELRAVIQRLGRARQTEEPDESRPPSSMPIMEQVHSLVPRTRDVHIPGAPTEARSIQRSANISRMLPSETLLLSQPRLKLLWYARHVERSLMTYEDDDCVVETVHVPQDAWQPSERRLPDRRLEMGPLILCVDTSGSMQGARELVAKATALEAMRLANLQQRPCYLYAFSGPGEVIERRLQLDESGFEGLIEFLGQTFHGGTDIGEPIERALQRICESEWKVADLLIVSDGEFGITRETEAVLCGAKQELGLRVQGILIGDRETIGMRQTCSDIYLLSEWKRFAEEDDPTRRHKSFAETYFPGALA
jgi:uncharacterized protein with von Willebrand factor type A (vWA) domain